MKNETVIRGLLALTLVASSILLFFFIETQRKYDELQTDSNRIIDSLSTQNFILSTEVGRYEIGIEIFKERNPSGSKQLEDILSHETE